MGFGSGGEGFTPGRNHVAGKFTVEGQLSASLGITGSSFTGDGSGLTNVGGGSITLTIGNSIATGAGNRVLYESSTNKLAESANLTFDGTTLTVATLDANGGAIDDVTVGATTPSSVRATTLSGSGVLKVVGAAQFGNTLAATGSLSSSVGLSGSAVKADGVISGSVGSYSSLLSNTTVRALTGLTGSSAKISGDVSGSVMITRDLTLDGTAVSSTATELNLLDGITAVTISGVSLGGTLGALSKASNSGLALSSYNGSAAVNDLAIDFNDLTEAVVNVAADSMMFLDNDGNASRRDSITDLATAMAGTGLSAASGQFTVDASQTQITAVGTIATGVWNGTAIANANLANSTISGKALGATLGALSKATNSGLALTSYDGSAAVSDLAINLHDLSAAAVTVASDSIAIIDGDDNSSKKESIEDLATAMAGTGLSAASGQFTVDASQTQITAVGTVATGDWQATDVAVAHGGTGASTAGAARTNLGLVIGTNVQAYDADLDTLSGMQSGAPGALALLTQTEIEILDGATVTSAEVNLLDASVVSEPANGVWASLTRWAKAEYDPSGGDAATADSLFDTTIEIPDNAVIVGGLVDVITTFTSAGGDAATLAIQTESADDIVAAVAISDGTNPWDQGLQVIKPRSDGTNAVKMTSAKNIKVQLGGSEALTAGKMVIWLQYVISE